MHPNEPPSVAVSRCGSTDPASDPCRTVVWVRGDHDIATRALLSSAFAQAARLDDADVVVDLSGLTSMDASTIGAMVDAHNRLRARSRSLSIRAVPVFPRRLLDVCGLAFLVDEHSASTQPFGATALSSWVAVPASHRAPGSTPSPVTQQPPAEEPARAPAQRPGEPVGSVQQRRAQS